MRFYPTICPRVNFPTILAGEISGPVRFESLDGSEFYDTTSDRTQFLNFKPFEKDGKTWAVSNIQKKSPQGWLKTDPDCYYWWRMFRLQEQDALGLWRPGTELGIYFRKPFSWRWDAGGTQEDGVLRHFIWTKGYLGAHYD